MTDVDSMGLAKVARLIAAVVKKQATGTLQIRQGDRSWSLLFRAGQLLWASDRQQRVRRWQRLLKRYSLVPNPPGFSLQDYLPGPETSPTQVDPGLPWELRWLLWAMRQGKLNAQQAKAAIYEVAVEVLFGIGGPGDVVCQWLAQPEPTTLVEVPTAIVLAVADLEAVLKETQKLQQRWQALGLSMDLSDRALKLSKVLPTPSPTEAAAANRDPEATPERETSDSSTYLSLAPLLNGKRSIWDLAALMRQPLPIAAHIIHHMVQQNLIDFVPLLDLPLKSLPPFSQAPEPEPEATPALLIACIDDSANVCNLMEKILVGAGYRFVGIQDSVKALPQLIGSKPDLIFLDLIMPIANGYEVCSQLRRVAMFKGTPIVILTGNDGAIDRVRSKVAGASDFLAKPIEAKKILAVVQKYLGKSSAGKRSVPASAGSAAPTAAGSVAPNPVQSARSLDTACA